MGKVIRTDTNVDLQCHVYYQFFISPGVVVAQQLEHWQTELEIMGSNFLLPLLSHIYHSFIIL